MPPPQRPPAEDTFLYDFLPIYIERYLKVKDARSLQTELGRIRKIKDLRHLAGSLMVMADVPLSKIAKILGHKQLVTTQRYAHLADRSLFEAVEKIGAVLNGNEGDSVEG